MSPTMLAAFVCRYGWWNFESTTVTCIEESGVPLRMGRLFHVGVDDPAPIEQEAGGSGFRGLGFLHKAAARPGADGFRCHMMMVERRREHGSDNERQ